MANIPIEIKNDLKLINAVADELKMKVYIVGGFVRDLVAGYGVDKDTDLDVTEVYGNAFDLAYFVATKYGLNEPVVYESSGTALIVMPSGRQIEFHNAYYNVPHIIDELYLLGIEPKPINKDVYARDFTINTLLLDIETEEILDITKKGMSDIRNKILRTPITPTKILSISPKNILRGVRFKIQFGLKSVPEYDKAVELCLPALIAWIQKNPNSEMLRRTVQKAFEFGAEEAYSEFAKIGILRYIPKQDEMDKIIKNKMFGTNIVASSSLKLAQLNSGPSMSTGMTGMKKRFMENRENHKSYLRRKKREKSQEYEKKSDILQKAREGYYTSNPETKYLKNKERNVRRSPVYEYIKHPR